MSLIMTKKTWKKRSLDGFLTLTFLNAVIYSFNRMDFIIFIDWK